MRIAIILLFREEDGITIVLLNSPLLIQINKNSVTTFLPLRIASSFYYSHINRKITILSLSSFAILNSYIFTLFFAALGLLED
jgi:hypothetical protein